MALSWGCVHFSQTSSFSPKVQPGRRTTGIAELSVEPARRDTERGHSAGGLLLATTARSGHPKATAADKKAGGMIPPLTIVSVPLVFDHGFFTGFLGARFAAGFLT